ncbi:MAG: phosphatidate cytidylyltransferase [Chloroflexota bacterium]
MPAIQLQPSLTIALSAVMLILGAATLGYWIIRWRTPSRGLEKMGLRIRFLWFLAVLALLSSLYSVKILVFYIGFMAFLALKEFLSITPTRQADRRVLFWAYLVIPIQFFLIWQGWYQAFILFTPFYMFFLIPLTMVIVGETHGFLRANGRLNWMVMTTVFSLGHLAYLLMVPAAWNPIAGGLGFFLFLVMMTQLNDVAQYVFGKIFDQPQLRLKVSTTRTWGSLIGSLVTSCMLSWLLAPLLTPFTTIQSLLAGVLIAVGCFFGYITFSAVKSDLQLKDRGSMTPGQGGILNRIDTLIYTTPLFFYFVCLLKACK